MPEDRRNNTEERTSSRRTALKQIGSTTLFAAGGLTGAASIPGISSAKEPSPEQIRRQAIKLRYKSQDHEVYKQFLRNHGFSIAGKQKTFEVEKPADSSGGISIQKLDRNDLWIEIDISKYHQQQKYTAELWWHWGNQDIDDWGEPPRDIVGFYWEDSDWNLATASAYTSTHVYFNGFSDTHTSFEFNDSKGDGGATKYCMSDLTPAGSASPSAREIGAEYIHTYDSISWDNIIGGFPWGLSGTFSNPNKTWDTQADQNGDPLTVSQADV